MSIAPKWPVVVVEHTRRALMLHVRCESCGDVMDCDGLSMCSEIGPRGCAKVVCCCRACPASYDLRIDAPFPPAAELVFKDEPRSIRLSDGGNGSLLGGCSCGAAGSRVLLRGYSTRGRALRLACELVRCGHRFSLGIRMTTSFKLRRHEHDVR